MPLGIARHNSLSRQIPTAGPFTLESVAFDASEYYSTSSISSTASDTTTITISYWLYVDSLANRVFNASFMSTNSRRIIGINPRDVDGKTRFYIQTDVGTLDRSSTETGLITTGNWHHIVMSADVSNSTLKVYVDGVAATFSGGTISGNIEWSSPSVFAINSDSNTLGNDSRASKIAQLYISNTYQDLDTLSVRQRFYNAGPVDMGSNGTASGADTPVVFHVGDTDSGFTTNGGSGWSYTLSTTGTPVDGGTVS